jgi:hypothetical protein
MKYKIIAWFKTFYWVTFKLPVCYWFDHKMEDDYCTRCKEFTWSDMYIQPARTFPDRYKRNNVK